MERQLVVGGRGCGCSNLGGACRINNAFFLLRTVFDGNFEGRGGPASASASRINCDASPCVSLLPSYEAVFAIFSVSAALTSPETLPSASLHRLLSLPSSSLSPSPLPRSTRRPPTPAQLGALRFPSSASSRPCSLSLLSQNKVRPLPHEDPLPVSLLSPANGGHNPSGRT